MTEREALKLALEALKMIDEVAPTAMAKLIIPEIEQALAQPEQKPEHVTYAGNGTAGFLEGERPTGFFIQADRRQPEQEPVVGTKTWFEDGKVVTQHLTAKDIYKEPEQEPVAWMFTDEEGTELFEDREDWKGKWTPLYTSPLAQRTWVWLTDKEIDQGLCRTNYAIQTAGAWRDGVEWAIKQLQERNT